MVRAVSCVTKASPTPERAFKRKVHPISAARITAKSSSFDAKNCARSSAAGFGMARFGAPAGETPYCVTASARRSTPRARRASSVVTKQDSMLRSKSRNCNSPALSIATIAPKPFCRAASVVFRSGDVNTSTS
eukprot:CAMPEP_0119222450 /NCGR_PEP_ID=MMETSP1327-20130426/30628_2 /TAXON_ID=38833 /ORGANISM="Micromonas pusilla, Strain RCC2306" /LENGTH=132 /DNA_ID=CAMNT_0007220659 /DNA_START=78 /DNA_END=472 /DNA_ORIENTATION=-